jgi:hypothetical protein
MAETVIFLFFYAQFFFTIMCNCTNNHLACYSILSLLCNGGRGTRVDWNPRYSTRGKDKVLRCSQEVEWDSVITCLRDKAGLMTRT